ncbi:flagellar FlbD family protein [Vagococcus sp.]|uniref:flagellar FlbD family protein n=1 Tax=Vagococcus sp. TaxID=1933889 RepID=UPI003F96DE0D
MIKLTKLNDTEFYLNTQLICTITTSPDTILTLTNGTTIMVKETSESVVQLVNDYQKNLSRHYFDNI